MLRTSHFSSLTSRPSRWPLSRSSASPAASACGHPLHQLHQLHHPAPARCAGRCRRLSAKGLLSAALCCSAPGLAQDLDLEQPNTGLPGITVSADPDPAARESYTADATGTATGLTLSPHQTPQSVSVVTRQRIEDGNLPTALDALLAAPGISAVRSDGNRTQLWARGFRIDNLQFDGFSSPVLAHWNYGATNMSSAIYERIEVVRGATGLMTGSGEPSAAVNFIRKQPLGKFAFDAMVGAGTWGERRASVDLSLPSVGDHNWRTRMVAETADGGSHVSWMGHRSDTFYGVTALDLTPRTQLSVGLEYQQDAVRGFSSAVPLFFSDGSRTSFDRSASNNTRWARMQTRSSTGLLDVRHRFVNDWTLRAAVNLNRGHYYLRHLFRGGFPDRDTGLGMTPYFKLYDGSRQRSQTNLLLSGPFSLLGRQHQAVLGWTSMVDNSRIDRQVEQTPLPDIGSFFDWRSSPVAEPQWAEQAVPADHRRVAQHALHGAGRISLAPAVHLILGARLENWKIDQYHWGRQRHYQYRHQLVPYAGAVVDLDSTYAVYGSYTSIFTPQFEQAADGSLLPPAEGRSIEAGLKAAWHEGTLNGAAAVFETTQRNLAMKTPGVFVVGQPTTQASHPARGVRVQGIELELTGKLRAGWQISSSYTRFITRSADGRPVYHQHPSTELKLFSTYKLSPQLTVGGGVDWHNQTRRVTKQPGGDGVIGQGSIALVNLMLKHQIGRRIWLALHVDNLFDRHYYSQMGFYSQGWVGDPRRLRATLRAKY